jgi:hypothetical protein
MINFQVCDQKVINDQFVRPSDVDVRPTVRGQAQEEHTYLLRVSVVHAAVKVIRLR